MYSSIKSHSGKHRKTSEIPVPVKNSHQKKKATSRLQMIGKLGQIAIPSVDQRPYNFGQSTMKRKD